MVESGAQSYSIMENLSYHLYVGKDWDRLFQLIKSQRWYIERHRLDPSDYGYAQDVRLACDAASRSGIKGLIPLATASILLGSYPSLALYPLTDSGLACVAMLMPELTHMVIKHIRGMESDRLVTACMTVAEAMLTYGNVTDAEQLVMLAYRSPQYASAGQPMELGVLAARVGHLSEAAEIASKAGNEGDAPSSKSERPISNSIGLCSILLRIGRKDEALLKFVSVTQELQHMSHRKRPIDEVLMYSIRWSQLAAELGLRDAAETKLLQVLTALSKKSPHWRSQEGQRLTLLAESIKESSDIIKNEKLKHHIDDLESSSKAYHNLSAQNAPRKTDIVCASSLALAYSGHRERAEELLSRVFRRDSPIPIRDRLDWAATDLGDVASYALAEPFRVAAQNLEPGQRVDYTSNLWFGMMNAVYDNAATPRWFVLEELMYLAGSKGYSELASRLFVELLEKAVGVRSQEWIVRRLLGSFFFIRPWLNGYTHVLASAIRSGDPLLVDACIFLALSPKKASAFAKRRRSLESLDLDRLCQLRVRGWTNRGQVMDTVCVQLHDAGLHDRLAQLMLELPPSRSLIKKKRVKDILEYLSQSGKVDVAMNLAKRADVFSRAFIYLILLFLGFIFFINRYFLFLCGSIYLLFILYSIAITIFEFKTGKIRDDNVVPIVRGLLRSSDSEAPRLASSIRDRVVLPQVRLVLSLLIAQTSEVSRAMERCSQVVEEFSSLFRKWSELGDEMKLTLIAELCNLITTMDQGMPPPNLLIEDLRGRADALAPKVRCTALLYVLKAASHRGCDRLAEGVRNDLRLAFMVDGKLIRGCAHFVLEARDLDAFSIVVWSLPKAPPLDQLIVILEAGHRFDTQDAKARELLRQYLRYLISTTSEILGPKLADVCRLGLGLGMRSEMVELVYDMRNKYSTIPSLHPGTQSWHETQAFFQRLMILGQIAKAFFILDDANSLDQGITAVSSILMASIDQGLPEMRWHPILYSLHALSEVGDGSMLKELYDSILDCEAIHAAKADRSSSLQSNKDASAR
jgi:hypothetical protein